jgi:stage II sporulation protein M
MKKLIREHIKTNKKKYLCLVLSFILGMILGYVSILFLSQETINGLKGYLTENLKIFLSYSDNLDRKDYFFSVFMDDVRCYLLMVLISMTPPGAFFPPLLMLYKGYTLGFSMSFVCGQFEANGILFAIVGIFLSNILKMIPLLFAANCSMSYSLKKIAKNAYSKKDNHVFPVYIIYVGASITLNAITIFTEIYVTSHFVFKLVKNML